MWRALLLCLVAALGLSCSDSSLYGFNAEDPSPDRLGLTGRVCTDDAREAGFPVKVVFLVDVAAGPVFSSWDLELQRINAIRDTLGVHSGNDDFSFAIVSMSGIPRLLAPQEGFFGRNVGELDAAVAQLGTSMGCLGGVCRDYEGSLDLAQSLIEGDLADLTAGQRARTQYVIITMTAGPPDPLECFEDCCTDTTCPTGCTEDWDCTTTTFREKVVDMRKAVQDRGALSLTVHTLLLAAIDPGAKNAKQVAADLAQTETMLEQMALVGGGTSERFEVADGITLDRVGLLRLEALLEPKSLMAVNKSVIPSGSGPLPDSDGDGLSDALEAQIGTTATSEDTDADGLGDYIETLVSMDPLTADPEPDACDTLGGGPYGDLDLDQMNDCEEALLGTNPSLPDSDGDGVLDWFELVYGTDYLADDSLIDSDNDGATNLEELLGHTDPRSSDAGAHLAQGYRYDVTDEGTVVEPTVYDPTQIGGVTVLSAGVDTTGGLGTLRYVFATPPKLSWQDAGDTGPGPAVDITSAGEYTLESPSVRSENLDRTLTIDVDPSLLPMASAEEALLVQLSERQCLAYTIRNIRLVETEAPPGGQPGTNDVYLYFAQAPLGRLDVPSLFRAVHIPVVYTEATGRTPSDPLVSVSDGEFASIGE